MASAALLASEHRAQIAELCGRFGVVRLALFGSAARGEFRPGASDFDFTVEFGNAGERGLANRYFGLLHGLEDLLASRIDLVDRASVTNPYFLPVAEATSEILYAA